MADPLRGVLEPELTESASEAERAPTPLSDGPRPVKRHAIGNRLSRESDQPGCGQPESPRVEDGACEAIFETHVQPARCALSGASGRLNELGTEFLVLLIMRELVSSERYGHSRPTRVDGPNQCVGLRAVERHLTHLQRPFRQHT
jgi:hypothetical protein